MPLTLYDANALKAAVAVIRRYPDDALHYLTRSAKDTTHHEAVLALALTALLEETKGHLAMHKMAVTVGELAVAMKRRMTDTDEGETNALARDGDSGNAAPDAEPHSAHREGLVYGD